MRYARLVSTSPYWHPFWRSLRERGCLLGFDPADKEKNLRFLCPACVAEANNLGMYEPSHPRVGFFWMDPEHLLEVAA